MHVQVSEAVWTTSQTANCWRTAKVSFAPEEARRLPRICGLRRMSATSGGTGVRMDTWACGPHRHRSGSGSAHTGCVTCATRLRKSHGWMRRCGVARHSCCRWHRSCSRTPRLATAEETPPMQMPCRCTALDDASTATTLLAHLMHRKEHTMKRGTWLILGHV